MDAAELERQVRRLAEIEQTLAAELLALDEEPTYTLLAASGLAGQTGRQVNDVISASSGLWLLLGALDGHIDRLEMMEPGGGWLNRSEDDHHFMINGPSLVVTTANLDQATTQLLGLHGELSEESAMVTPHGVITAFRSLFERVRAVVDEVDAVWGDLMPRIDAATRALDRGDAIADRLGTPVPQLRIARQRLDAMRSLVSDDPLSMTASAGESLQRVVDEAVDEIDRLDRDHRSLDADVGSMERVIADVRVLRARAAASYSEAAAKIVGAKLARIPGPGVVDGPTGLAHQASELQDFAARPEVEWRSLKGDVESWHRSVNKLASQLQRGLEKNRAPLSERNELRGRFDAFKIKARGRAGMIADEEEVERLVALLHGELYSAPTNLETCRELLDQLSSAL